MRILGTSLLFGIFTGWAAAPQWLQIVILTIIAAGVTYYTRRLWQALVVQGDDKWWQQIT